MAECHENTSAGKGEEGNNLYLNAYYIATHEGSLSIYNGMKGENVEEVISVVNGY